MRLNVFYSKKATKFLDKNPSIISLKEVRNLIILAIKKIFFGEEINLDLKRLKGELSSYFRIRKGKIRIIFSIKENKYLTVFVNNIDHRGSIY